MSDGMNTVILMNTVLGYECSVDEAMEQVVSAPAKTP